MRLRYVAAITGKQSRSRIHGKIVVITGATSGIGQIAAERLAGLGARMLLIARDRARGAAALDRLNALAPGVAHTVRYADLSSLAQTKRVADEIAAAEPRIDVLINNAGAIFSRRAVTSEGFERTFALNHMSYFVLTSVLRDRLIAGAPARIVNTASNAHRAGHLDFNDLQSERRYRPFRVYGTTKLCNILFTRELARRMACGGVTANSMTPGFVATRFGDESGGVYALGTRISKLLFAKRPETGAETLVYLACAPEAATVSGEFFQDRRAGRLTAAAQEVTAAQRLWRESERLAAPFSVPPWP
jgi:NAD(P)-dependent dehydrogenase (short-subunit alcohol dehydrogenase family)